MSMINRDDIKHGAILKPRFTKQRRPRAPFCSYFKATKRHALAPHSNGRFEQCIECGVKRKGDRGSGIYNYNANRERS